MFIAWFISWLLTTMLLAFCAHNRIAMLRRKRVSGLDRVEAATLAAAAIAGLALTNLALAPRAFFPSNSPPLQPTPLLLSTAAMTAAAFTSAWITVVINALTRLHNRPNRRAITLPPQLQPRWRDLPRLASVLERSFGLPPARLPYVGTLYQLPMATAWFASLLSMRAGGELVANSPHALITVSARNAPRRWGRMVCGALAGIAMLLAALTVVLVALHALTEWSSVPLDAAVYITASIIGIAEFGAHFTKLIRHRGRMPRAVTQLSPYATVYEVGFAAAWPRKHRHFSRLITPALAWAEETDGVVLVAVAGDEKLARMYTRLGFVPFTDDELILAYPQAIVSRALAMRPMSSGNQTLADAPPARVIADTPSSTPRPPRPQLDEAEPNR